ANCFMNLAWYGHLTFLPNDAPLWQAILLSWAIALFEYTLMIPANKIMMQQGLTVGQMKVTQEFVTLMDCVLFMFFLFKQPFRLDYLWAALCLCGCVYFVFRTP